MAVRIRSVLTFNRPSRWALSCLLAAVFAAALLSGCGNVGNYDAAEIASLAQNYYNSKYDDQASVVDISEETADGLFGASSLNNFFCTMSDGTIVYYERGEERDGDVFKDNRQAAEICSLYISCLRGFEKTATQCFVDAGYKASVEFDDWYKLSDEEISKCIAYEEWTSGDNDYSGSYFHTRLNGQGSDYIAEERPYASIQIDTCCAYISGPDAQYAGAFPTGVPEEPAWQEAANSVVASLEKFYGGMSHIEVQQAPDGTRNTAEVVLGNGFVNAYDDAWLICDYVEVGEGIWVSSNEHGLRFAAGDFVLAEATDAPTFAELIADGSNPRSGNSSAYAVFELKFTDEAAARAESTLEELGMHGGGWASFNFAYDTQSVKQADGLPYENAVRLYAIEKNEVASISADEAQVDTADEEQGNASDEARGDKQDDEPKYYLSRITYEEEPLPNGMLSGRDAIYFNKPLLIARL